MCSYCGCETITVIGRFMAEHIAVVNALGELRRAVARQDAQAVAFHGRSLGDLLAPHARAEEVGLFTVMGRQEEFAAHISALCAEHRVFEEQLDGVMSGRSEQMDPLYRGLREHIDREENGLFPAAAIALGGLEWEEVDALTPSE